MTPQPATVLVVDDHVDTCELLVRLMRASGYHAVCTTSGRDALTYLDHSIPTLILLDVMMPEMSGLDVLTAVRADPRSRGVSVVMYSAVTDAVVQATARRLGADDFVVKGRLHFNELRAVVDRYVASS